jgi:integrase
MGTRQVVGSTRARDESIWACQIGPVFGKVKLAGLRRSDIAGWVADLADDYAVATVTRCLVVLKKCLTDAVAEGLIGASPAAGIKPPRPEQVERRFLALAELARLEAAIDPHWRLVIPFAAQTGLRIGELAALTVGDLNLAAREVRVRATAVGVPMRVSGANVRRQLHQPKTRHGQRVVPTLTDPLARRIVTYIAERGLGPTDPLFAGPRGGPMDSGNWRNRVWAPAVEAARLADPQPTPHSLRHTAVALWIAAGADRLTVARWAGHGDAGFTERVYGHLFPDTHDRTRTALEAVLAGHVTRLPTRGSQVGLSATSG